MRDRQCALNHDATGFHCLRCHCVYHLHTDDLLWRNFLSPQCRNCSRDPDHAHLGSTHSSHNKDFTWPTRVQNLKSLALAVGRYYMGCKILKRVIWPWPRPFQRRFFFGRVGRAMVSKCTKYEVSRFTRYEAVNGLAKCRKWGDLGWLGGTQGQRQCHHSIERIRLPIRL